jgi:uncharacterized protein (TIGR03435 family)
MRALSRILILTLILTAGVALLFSAQAPGFDVASIKPTLAAPDSAIQLAYTGRLTATSAPLRSLILRAYNLHESQLIDAPGWLATEKFDVDARVAAVPPGGPDALLPMFRTLLAERFRLRLHNEKRELSAFILTRARRDGRLGPQIKATQADCTRATELTATEIRAQARDGWPPCGMVYTVSYVAQAATGLANRSRVRRSGISMQDFATALQTSVDRPVVDRTSLEGRFDIEYSFATASDIAAGIAGNLPVLLVALEEQLGLKLDAQRTQVPVLVIDSVDRLIEN